jgi:hypothetical protein
MEHVLVGQQTALVIMRDVVALWCVGHKTAADIVYSACDLLVNGLDGPALRALAAVPLDQADIEVAELLEPAMKDIGLPYYSMGSTASLQAGLVAMASQTLSGAFTPGYLAAWAYETFGHQVDFAADLARFDDVYEVGDGTNSTREDVDKEVIAEARRIVESSGHESLGRRLS